MHYPGKINLLNKSQRFKKFDINFRLSIRSQFTRGISTDNILYFKATPCLL